MVEKIFVVTAALFIAAVAAVFVFLSDNTLIDEKAGSAINNPVGFVLKYVGNEKETVPFRAELSFEKDQKIDFAFDDEVDSFYVDYVGPESKFIINGLSLRSPGDSHIEFIDYIGNVHLSEKLIFSGSSKRVRADNNTLSKEKSVSVSGNDVVFSKVFLSKLQGQSLVLYNVTGNVEIFVDGSSANIPLNNRKFDLSYFDGEIQYYKDHVIINGDGRLDFDFFRAPSV
ncbi:MAG: hypothetical protein ABIG84_02765 [archaeon]